MNTEIRADAKSLLLNIFGGLIAVVMTALYWFCVRAHFGNSDCVWPISFASEHYRSLTSVRVC
jgi:hypothetical protein